MKDGPNSLLENLPDRNQLGWNAQDAAAGFAPFCGSSIM